MRLNYRNDKLLHIKNHFVNGHVNLYAVLLKKEDMLNNKKGVILKKSAYILDRDGSIKEMICTLDTDNYFKLRQALSDYLCIKRIRKDTFVNWLHKGLYPLPLVRIIFLLNNKPFLRFLASATISDFCQQSYIKFPTKLNDISSKFMAYFVGLHLGDGTLNSGRWKITDGDRDPRNLSYTFRYLSYLKMKLHKLFGLKHTPLYRVPGKNAYELEVRNKWFSRYLNYVYGLEFNEKLNPKIPSLLKNRVKFVLRGLFDTDGSIKNYRLSFGTKYLNLHKTVCSILRSYKISYKIKLNGIKRTNVVYNAEVRKQHVSKFIKLIGFSHPRKLLESKKYLLTTSSERNFVRYKRYYKPKISKRAFIELCHFVRPIKNGAKVRFLNAFRKLNSRRRSDLLNNFKFNFDTDKEPNYRGYVSSSRIERIMTKYCLYAYKRNPLSHREINNLGNNLMAIWR